MLSWAERRSLKILLQFEADSLRRLLTVLEEFWPVAHDHDFPGDGPHLGVAALGVRCDVSQPDQVKAALDKTIETFGRLDFAFNNAGVEQLITTATGDVTGKCVGPSCPH